MYKGPPAVEVVGQGAGANFAEAVEFGEVFDFYDGLGHKQLTINNGQWINEIIC